MLSALSPTAFSRKIEYASLVQETASKCIPKACPNRGQTVCEQHVIHEEVLYRHCGTRGELIHIIVRVSHVMFAVKRSDIHYRDPNLNAMANAAQRKNIFWYTIERIPSG